MDVSNNTSCKSCHLRCERDEDFSTREGQKLPYILKSLDDIQRMGLGIQHGVAYHHTPLLDIFNLPRSKGKITVVGDMLLLRLHLAERGDSCSSNERSGR